MGNNENSLVEIGLKKTNQNYQSFSTNNQTQFIPAQYNICSIYGLFLLKEVVQCF